MNNKFFRNKNNKEVFVSGLQVHNSSTGTEMIDKAICAVKKFHGNTIEIPIYWYMVEPKKDEYDFSIVKEIIKKIRSEKMNLIFLWFGSNKNGHPNYMPEYIKLNPEKYQVAKGADGQLVASMSPHCEATLKRDKKAFVEFIKVIKKYDMEEKTVLAVQIENETGLANTDRDYSDIAWKDYNKQIPAELKEVHFDKIELNPNGSTWIERFDRYANEVFTAWYHAKFINEIAKAGKEIYNLPYIINVMIGEQGIEEPGFSYNSGGAVGRMIDIYKIAAPSLDIICPDIYCTSKEEYSRVCERYQREDNPLFIPESPNRGMANALNCIRAVADYNAIGVCLFGAETTLDNSNQILDNSKELEVSMKIINNISPLLIKYHKSNKIHSLIQEEFMSEKYIELENYHITAEFISKQSNNIWLGSKINWRSKENENIIFTRGRGILVQSDVNEFFLSGAGIKLNFIKKPKANSDNRYLELTSRMSTQLNFLSVEEGHFENGKWVIDYIRNGDEANGSLYVHNGQIVRIRLNLN